MISDNVTHLHQSDELTEYDVWMDDEKVFRYRTNNRPALDNLAVFLGRKVESRPIRLRRRDPLRHIGNYIEGKREGSFFWYHPNGTLQAERRFISGKQDGPARHFDERGKLIREEMFEGKEKVSDLHYLRGKPFLSLLS